MTDSAEQLQASLAEELQPATLLRSLITASLLLVMTFVFSASYAALIYADVAPDQLAQGIGMMIIGSAFLVLVVALLSAYKGSIAIGQNVAAAVFAISATAVAGVAHSTEVTASSADSGATTFTTIVVMIALTTLVGGVIFMLLGAFKLGNLIRFLPYPVMGGFLAGTGYLLIRGGVGIMLSNTGLTLFEPAALVRWVPAAVLGLVLFLVSRRSKNPQWLPLIIVAAGVLFYLVAWTLGSSPADLSAQGWLVGGLPSSGLWQFPLSPQLLEQTDWNAIAAQITVLIPMIIINAIAMLLNATGLELILRRDLDLNHELVIAGIANIAGGLTGAFLGFHAVSLTSLNHSLSGGRRLPGLLLAALLLLSIVFGASLIAYIPKVVLGGLVLFVGFMLLINWVYDSWFKFPSMDYLIVILILIAIAWQGFVVGVVIGFLVALIIFVFNYSRTTIIRNALSGADYRSRVMRSPAARDALAELSNEVLILRLQGFIFFGTANSLFEQVRLRARAGTLRYVIMDFERVQGLDSTGMLSFEKMRHLALDNGITLVLTGASPTIKRQLTRGGFDEEPSLIRYFDNLDRGLEWYEDELLAARPQPDPSLNSLDAQLQYVLPGAAVAGIRPFLTRLDTSAGDVLIHQGDAPDLMYFVESGRVTAQFTAAGDSAPTRLETMQGGHVVGELGFFLGTQRTADVVVDQSGVVYSLSRADLDRMQREDPEAYDTFQNIIIQLIGQRLVNLTRAFQALQE